MRADVDTPWAVTVTAVSGGTWPGLEDWGGGVNPSLLMQPGGSK